VLKKKVNRFEKLKNILYVNTFAGRGGAAEVAYQHLYKGLSKQFHTEMLVAKKNLEDLNVNLLPEESNKDLIQLQERLGYQDFFCLNSFKIKELRIFKNCDILHLHNLLGGYFSPFALPELTSLKPTIWTLHDMHSFTGHCIQSLNCNKWRKGCHSCKYLNLYPAISVDTSSLIYNIKKEIYNMCKKITIVTVSNWLKERVKHSILRKHDIRTIYNGIDEKIFFNYEKQAVRKELSLPNDKKIILFCCDYGDTNPW
jgi:hypothetical protein